MSALEGARKEIRPVIKDGTAYWTEFKDRPIHVADGRACRRFRQGDVSREEAWDCIAGFAPATDFGCHDFRDTDAGSMLRVKGMDGFLPDQPRSGSGVDVRQLHCAATGMARSCRKARSASRFSIAAT